jgi:nucleoside-diphosphate-sugar epimerase
MDSDVGDPETSQTGREGGWRARCPHTVTYIEDFARALVTLGEREEALGAVWHVPNDETVTTRRFVEMVFAEVSRPPRLRAAPRWGPRLGGTFHIDTEFYDEHYQPGAYLETHAKHMQRWHGAG